MSELQIMENLEEDQIHIWCVNLEQLSGQSQHLDLEERGRADNIRIKQVQQRFINGRGFLRYLLSHYLNTSTQAISFNIGPYGKLYLPDNPIFFNLAHSKYMAMYAFNYQHEIGIDIEHRRPMKDLHAIAQRVFSPIEQKYLFSERDNDKTSEEIFFQLWTRKEAIIKATGEGLSAPLSTISTTLETGELNDKLSYACKHNLKIKDLPTIDDFDSALAANFKDKEIKYFYPDL